MLKYIRFILCGILILLISFGIFRHFQPYYKKYPYIAHALGGIDGLDYTNSKEALMKSVSKGYHLIEVDLSYTSDGHLVCRHNWSSNMGDGYSKSNIPSYETFMSGKVGKSYSPLDIEGMIEFAKKYPDLYFILDIKPRNVTIADVVQEIVDTADKMEFTNIDKQFIIQFYNYEEYKSLSKQFAFENYIFTMYRMKDEIKENGVTNIIEFCKENNIKVVTIPKKYATKEIIHEFSKSGITIYVHTIDSMRQWLELRLNGVDGIYTNFIWPTKIRDTIIKKTILTVSPALLPILFIYLIFKFWKSKRNKE
jgi:glycerophosphoryl diester phosphodiesterase